MQELHKKDVIIGGGISGLVAAFYIDQSIIIDKNPLGQFASQISLGPRLINYDKFTQQFVLDFYRKFPTLFNCINKIAIIGYESNNEVFDSFSDEFKNKYVEITRDKNSNSASYLSGGKNKIEYLSFKEFNEFSSLNTFKFIFNDIIQYLIAEKRIIFQHVDHIDTRSNTIYTIDKKITYDNLISTIRIDKFLEVVDSTFKLAPNIDKDKFILLPKFFYKCKYNEKEFQLSKNFNYIYSIDGEFTRKTYFDNYIVYETTKKVNDDRINNCQIIDRFENIPLQIKNNIFFNNRIENVFFSGRFAEWNHSVKLGENISRALEIYNLILQNY